MTIPCRRAARLASAAPVAALAILLLAPLLLAGCGSGKPSEEVKLGGIALTEVLDGQLRRARIALEGVRDVPTAQDAKVRLAEVNDGLDDLMYHAPKLSPAGQKELAKRAEKHLTDVANLAQMVQASPGLSPIIGREVGELLVKVKGLTHTPYVEQR